MAKSKLTPLLAIAIAVSLLFLYSTHSARQTWRQLPFHVGLGEHFGQIEVDATRNGSGSGRSSGNGRGSGTTPQDPNFANWNPKPNFTKGSPKTGGYNYSTTLVVATVKDEDTKWIEENIPADIATSIWVADDPSAPLHPPKNKGHEVMIYLSWIIDNYDSLPDIALFLHAHQHTWHNDDILGHNAVEMINRLNRARVWREGYVNMRCTWFPGCPEWMHPGETEFNGNKMEEGFLAKSWSELFPLDPIPAVLAQPCSAQFALSRERILAKPHAQYIWYREWLFNTKISDSVSGRIWEYMWQFVFTGRNVFCPTEQVCYCDQYGSCFGGEKEYEAFAKVKQELYDRENDLRRWEDLGKKLQEAMEKGDMEEAGKLERPEWGKDAEYRIEIDRLRPIVDKLRDEAVERGKSPQNRARELGREWKEGDGF